MAKVKVKACCYCGQPASVERIGLGRRNTRTRAWCRRCMASIRHYGTVEREDDYPTTDEARNCKAPASLESFFAVVS